MKFKVGDKIQRKGWVDNDGCDYHLLLRTVGADWVRGTLLRTKHKEKKYEVFQREYSVRTENLRIFYKLNVIKNTPKIAI